MLEDKRTKTARNNGTSPNIYLIVIGSNIGGTEKRFLEIWNYFQEQGIKNVTLVISAELLKHAENVDYLKHLSESNKNLIVLNGGHFRDAAFDLIKLANKSSKECIFHYPGVSIPFLHTVTRHKFILSNTISSFFEGEYSSLKTKTMFLGSALTAWKIDILNPSQFNEFERRFPFLSHKTTLTPQNFVNHNAYKPIFPKKNDIVFLGRLSEGDTKNVIPLVKSIPKIHYVLRENNIKDVRFFILGHGILESQVRELLSKDAYRDIPIIFEYEPNPGKILAQSKIILSLQKHSNYPSRSLLEGMSCGNIPIVTDVGETRLIAKESFSKFVSPEFTSIELAQNIKAILSMDEAVFEEQASSIRTFIIENYSIRFQAQYYLDLYELDVTI